MKQLMQQRGSAVLEVLLLAVVAIVFGYVAITAYQKHQNNTASTIPAGGVSSVRPNSSTDGSVDSVVNSTSSDSSADDGSSVSTSSESSQITAPSSAATNIGGSYNENSY